MTHATKRLILEKALKDYAEKLYRKNQKERRRKSRKAIKG